MTNATHYHPDVPMNPAENHQSLASGRYPSWPADNPLWDTTNMRRSVRSI